MKIIIQNTFLICLELNYRFLKNIIQKRFSPISSWFNFQRVIFSVWGIGKEIDMKLGVIREDDVLKAKEALKLVFGLWRNPQQTHFTYLIMVNLLNIAWNLAKQLRSLIHQQLSIRDFEYKSSLAKIEATSFVPNLP